MKALLVVASQCVALHEALRIEVSNKYTRLLGKAIGVDYPWVDDRTAIVDAYSAYSGALVDENGTRVLDATWALTSDGASVDTPVFAGLAPGKYTLRASTPQKEEATVTLVSSYVRREVRELDAKDRERLLKAMRVVYDTPTVRGRELYGPSFLGADGLVTLHHSGACQRDADHLHQGVGFLAQHAKFTKLFEDSLQSVDERVCLPYWDPTIEMAALQDGSVATAFDSAVFSSDWFGTVSSFVDDQDDDVFDASAEKWAIQDGPFAFLETMLPENLYQFDDAESDDSAAPRDPLPTNAYGLLRAPWNNNPSRFVTRYPRKTAKLPTCQTYQLFAESAVDAFGGDSWVNGRADRARWMYDVSNGPHGSMHGTPGGVPVVGETNALSAETLKQFGVKDVKQHTLWRFHVLEFPTDCRGDDLRDCGGPTCNLNIFNLTAIGYEIVKAQNPLPSFEILEDWKTRPDDLRTIASAYCFGSGPDFIISGDAKDSGGALEPSFWPIHPGITRLYQYRLLFGPPFLDTSWPAEYNCFGARSQDFDPDRFAVVQDETTGQLRACSFAECCGGHFAESRLYASYPHVEVGPTNSDTLALIDPTRHTGFPVYHHFEFSHCEALGVHFQRRSNFLDQVNAMMSAKLRHTSST
mmetsp:Transcript_19118/g.58930  ORF Transcript_19118/g.58930 Transcript_19118/m.58930 type:complete len:640 (-) Transcript_19118:784-2703(-)